jgi:hypothetical protein
MGWGRKEGLEEGEVVQTMYTHVRKCKNDKRKTREKKNSSFYYLQESLRGRKKSLNVTTVFLPPEKLSIYFVEWFISFITISVFQIRARILPLYS